MKNIFFALIFLLLQLGCQTQQISVESSKIISPSAQTITVTNSNTSKKLIENESQDDEKKYPGVTIDQVFPIVENYDFMDENLKGKPYSVKADEFQVTVKNFAPKTISKNRKAIFNFTTLYKNDYHSNLVGISHLLGKNSKQIYVAALGPGAVCCTNYWITDVSNGTPRNIFRSEDFGGFRDEMEIFDADNDGIYEIVQFDSAFRYFMDDCGACSPEPRAVFKYDKKSNTYLAAKNLQQDFVKESFANTEKLIVDKFNKIKVDKTVLSSDYSHIILEYVVDLFYIGEEKKAWEIFDTYYIGYSDKEKVRAEIKNRLKQSKFFQALKNQK